MIQIFSRERLFQETRENPNTITAIAIYEVGCYDKIERIVPNCKECLPLEFNDTTSEDRPGSPTIEHVKQALNWAEGKENIVVACAAGISRSSAIAYLIQCMRTDPSELYSIDLLDHSFHFPNELILKHGTMLLPDYNLNEYCQDIYRSIAAKKNWKLESVTKYFRG
jgi:predicted protein tyrosine phosphatase